MPNQRKAGKKKVGVWLTDAEKEELRKIAKQHKVNNLSDFLHHLIKTGGKIFPMVILGHHLLATDVVARSARMGRRQESAWVVGELEVSGEA